MADLAFPAERQRSVVGWKLDRAERDNLLRQFAPRFTNPMADHVTLDAHAWSDAHLPFARTGHIVGRVDDGRGVEAMIVEIDGTTDRPGGGTYHITWSLASGRRANESNDVLERHAWVMFDRPIPIRLLPARI